MTCLVAVMNARGIALAADSAVTLGEERKKIYNTAEKLFQLSPGAPVGIMTFGSADMMGIPWETIVKGFAQKLGDRKFDTLQEYAASFFAFIEGSAALFPGPRQAEYMKRMVGSQWFAYRDEFEQRIEDGGKTSAAQRAKMLDEIIQADLQDLEAEPPLESVGAKYGSLVTKTYARELDEIETEIFDGFQLRTSTRKELRNSVEQYFSRQYWGPYMSGIVIAGMGEEEPFPVVLQYSVETMAADKLRYAMVRDGRVDLEYSALVMPFAQRETIDMIIMGVHPEMRAALLDETERRFGSQSKPSSARAKTFEEFREGFDRYINERYEDPFMSAVAALPRQDLAKMAEALVNLTAFVKRMSVDQDETVSGPIDVALLSKADGFTWVRRKDLLREAGQLTS